MELLRRGSIAGAERDRGRFRTFLLTALTRFVANQNEARAALKRGGGVRTIPLESKSDREEAERRFALEPLDLETPERLFNATWARSLLENVLSMLREGEAAHGRQIAFGLFAPRLYGESEALLLAEIARQLGTSAGAAKVALHRLRRHFRELLLAEVRGTLREPAELEDEIRALFEALGRK